MQLGRAMPSNSINTNVGAMVAISTFNAINAEMAEVQLRITTGRKVNSVKDNPAIWAIAQNQRAEVRGLDAVKSSLQRGMSVVDVAITAAESVSELLNEMKALAVSAADYPASDPPAPRSTRTIWRCTARSTPPSTTPASEASTCWPAAARPTGSAPSPTPAPPRPSMSTTWTCRRAAPCSRASRLT
jgi:protoporphyrinogen oxidase